MKEKEIKKAIDNLLKTIVEQYGIATAIEIEYKDTRIHLLVYEKGKYTLEINRYERRPI